MAAHLKARKQAKPLTSSLAVERPAIAVGQPTGNFKVETPSTPAIVPETSGEEETEASEQEQEQVLTIDGKVVTPEEQSSLVKFFNDPSKRSVALSINYIGSKTMDNLESKRPLTWDVLVDSLSQIQLESAMKWLRSHPNYT
jgi:2-succinyl-5-enolpyruvyl-6-hydroxy-3-cyclohexene-1-carboxylate synthase